MEVVIFCGGLGTRLREETEFRPKPMVNIGNRPILWHIMKIFAHHGHKDFRLALGYKGHVIKEYFSNYELQNNDMFIQLGKPDQRTYMNCNHDEKDWNILLADTGELNLKGSRLKQMEKYIEGDNFFVTYGDGVADIDINALMAFHKSHGKIATVTGVNPTARFGELGFEGDSVTSFMEKPSTSQSNRLISGGFFVFNQKIFDYLSNDEKCDLEYGALEKLAGIGELKFFRHTAFWACMDNLRDMDYLNRLWNQGKADWKVWTTNRMLKPAAFKQER